MTQILVLSDKVLPEGEEAPRGCSWRLLCVHVRIIYSTYSKHGKIAHLLSTHTNIHDYCVHDDTYVVCNWNLRLVRSTVAFPTRDSKIRCSAVFVIRLFFTRLYRVWMTGETLYASCEGKQCLQIDPCCWNVHTQGVARWYKMCYCYWVHFGACVCVNWKSSDCVNCGTQLMQYFRPCQGMLCWCLIVCCNVFNQFPIIKTGRPFTRSHSQQLHFFPSTSQKQLTKVMGLAFQFSAHCNSLSCQLPFSANR